MNSDRYRLQRLALAHGDIAWRDAGMPGLPALVLLHGIGSGSASWSGVFDGLAEDHHLIAWDAPGYGGSAALREAAPLAAPYAQALEALLRARAHGPVTLVGHSLGAIVAAAAAARAEVAVRALVLASPAQGYGQVAAELRESKYRERLDSVERLGIEGLAATRSAALCAPGASETVLAAVRENMALATPGGYKQAAHLLAHDDLRTHLHRVKAPVAVLCGELDTITPPKGARALAEEFHLLYRELRGVAHALYVEDPAQFSAVLSDTLSELNAAPH